MKFILYIIAIILLGYICHIFLPWWSIVVVAFIVGIFTKDSGIRAFAIGFLGVALLWGIYAAFINSQNDSILANRMGELLGGMGAGSLVLVTALIGGLVGGLGALTGNLGRKIFS
ncbi:MAG: hypothetical protein ACI8P3_002874 [Saprospiraceae bacterium]|jgi:hypothetical protein